MCVFKVLPNVPGLQDAEFINVNARFKLKYLLCSGLLDKSVSMHKEVDQNSVVSYNFLEECVNRIVRNGPLFFFVF